jgi:membrane associated rhomboid family serine protease
MISKYFFPITLLVMVWFTYFITLLDSSGTIYYYFSLRPQMFSQIHGIFTCNLLHQDYAHIYNNSIPLLILSIIFYITERKTHSSFLRGWDVSDKLFLII